MHHLPDNEEEISEHSSDEEQPGGGELYKFPKVRRPRNDPKARKDRSKAQERGIARSYRESGFQAARRIPGSGAFQGLKGDVEVENYLLVECKETRTGRLVVEPAWFDKIEKEANQAGKRWWAVHGWVASSTSDYRKFVVVPEKTWLDIMGQIKAYESKR